MSSPGARALWLDTSIELAHPELIVAGREFTHIHPDGSMHLSLPVERAREAITSGWAEPHPIARQIGMEEREVLWELVLDAYCYVTGRPRPAPDPVA